jgi:hypothetical protein
MAGVARAVESYWASEGRSSDSPPQIAGEP